MAMVADHLRVVIPTVEQPPGGRFREHLRSTVETPANIFHGAVFVEISVYQRVFAHTDQHFVRCRHRLFAERRPPLLALRQHEHTLRESAAACQHDS